MTSRDHFNPIGYGTPMTDIDRIHAAMSSKPTDIVERLRDPNVISMAVRLEAAAEIERLTAERDAYHESNERLAAIVSGKNAEIERLRKRYERDMANVHEARRALEPKP